LVDAAPPREPVVLDDRPVRLKPGEQPPEVQAPLAIFGGEEPPAPKWFHKALANAPERRFVTSNGTQIELLTWGEIGKPGLLLIHGGAAHADWWSFIAPFLAGDHRVAAMSLPGMGASGWREAYLLSDFAADAEACARAAGLYEDGGKPIYIGHSFGGAVTYYIAWNAPQQMRAAILVDTGFAGPPTSAQKTAVADGANAVSATPSLDRGARVYPTLATALARFRFMPPQPVENLYIADLIARRSLKRAPMPDGSGEGWSWRFDPELWDKLDSNVLVGLGAGGGRPTVPVVHAYGENSYVIGNGMSTVLSDLASVVIPDSHHHVLVDQPLALTAALRSLLAVWPS